LFWDLFVKINCCSNRIGATFKPTNKTEKKLWGSEREPPLCVKGGKGPVLPGLEATSPPIEQKSTAIWQKLTASSYF
jgi:hypothetical protein